MCEYTQDKSVRLISLLVTVNAVSRLWVQLPTVHEVLVVNASHLRKMVHAYNHRILEMEEDSQRHRVILSHIASSRPDPWETEDSV